MSNTMPTSNSPTVDSPLTTGESQSNLEFGPSNPARPPSPAEQAAVSSVVAEDTDRKQADSTSAGADPVSGAEDGDPPAPQNASRSSIGGSDSLFGDLLQHHGKIGDWNELVDQEPVPERPPSIPSPSATRESIDRKASGSSGNIFNKPRPYHNNDMLVEFHEPYYACVSGIDYAASKLEIFYYFGGPSSVIALYLYTNSTYPDVVPQTTTGENQQKQFSGECFMQLSSFRALIDVLKKDHTELLSRPVNVFHVNPETLYQKRYTLEQLANARQAEPRGGRYQPQQQYSRSSPRRDSGDVRVAMQNDRNFGAGTDVHGDSNTTPLPLAAKPSSASIFGQAKPVDQMKKFEEIQSKIETEKRLTVPPPPSGVPAPPHSTLSTDLAPSGGDTVAIHGCPNSSLTRQSSSSSSARHYQYPQQQLTVPNAHGGPQQRTYQDRPAPMARQGMGVDKAYNVPPPPLPPQQRQFTKILTHDVGASILHPPPQHRTPYYSQQSLRPPYHQNNNRQPSTPPSSSSPNVPVPLNQCNPHQQAPPPLPPPQFDTSLQLQWGVSNEVEKKASTTDASIPDNLPQPADESGGVQRGSTSKYRGGLSNRPYQNQQHQHQHHRQQNQYSYQVGKAYPQAAGDGKHHSPHASQPKQDSEELKKELESVHSDVTGRGEGKEKREKGAGSRINRTTSDDRAHRGYKKGSLGARSSIPAGQSGAGGGASNSLRREELRKGSDDASTGDEKKEGEKSADSGRPAFSKENSNDQSRSNRPHIRPKEINKVRDFIQHDSQATRDRDTAGQRPRDGGGSDRGDTRSRRVGGGGGDGTNRLPYNRGGGGGGRNYPRNINNNNRYGSTDNKERQKGYSEEGGATIGGKGESEGPPKKSSVSKSRADEIPSDGVPRASAPQALKTVRSDSTPSFSVLSAEESDMNKARASTGRANSAEKALETNQQKGKDGAAEESENGGEKKTAGGKTNAKAKKKGPKRGKEDTSGSPVITSNKFTALSSMD